MPQEPRRSLAHVVSRKPHPAPAGTMTRARTMPSIRSPAAHRVFLLSTLLVAFASPCRAQISLTTAVDLALRNSPRVQTAAADAAHAQALLEESRDVYLPSLSGGSGLGYSYGFPLGQPTLFNFQAQSLAFSFSQKDYIRAARDGLQAANLALMEARQVAVEDAVNTCIALDHDASRRNALNEEQRVAAKLVSIVQDRLDAGQDTPMGLTSSRLAAAQIRLNLLHAEDDAVVDQAHLAHLTGLPVEGLRIETASIPAITTPADIAPLTAPTSPGVQAAYARARAKQEQAFGDARYLWRPQVAFAAEYSRFSTFNNYQEYYEHIDPVTKTVIPFQYNAAALGIQITLPILDYTHKAKARQAAADAVRATHEADQERDQFTEGRLRTQRSTLELAARAEVASLDQELARQQLDILELQLQTTATGAAPMTPKDEQNARLTERDKYLALLDAQFQMRQAQIDLLRQTGDLESWLKSTTPKVH